MDGFLEKFHFLKSRKFWAAVSAAVTLLTAASTQDPYPIDTVIQGLVAIALGYMGTTAWEDTAMKKAMMAPMTTVETPSDNVTVSTSDTTQPAPGQPVVHSPELGRMG